MRSGFTSIASVLIMTITLFVITSLIFIQAALTASLNDLKDKVDVTAYFVPGASETSIKNIQTSIEKIPEVKSVEYVSEDEALIAYKTKHANDHVILQVFDILDSNPLGASLNIKAKDPSQYENIVYRCDAVTLRFDRRDPIGKAYYETTAAIQTRQVVCAEGRVGCARNRVENTTVARPISGKLHLKRIDDPPP